MTQQQYQHDPSKAELKSHITELTRRFIIIHKLAKESRFGNRKRTLKAIELATHMGEPK